MNVITQVRVERTGPHDSVALAVEVRGLSRRPLPITISNAKSLALANSGLWLYHHRSVGDVPFRSTPPCSRSRSATSLFPFSTAQCSGVVP